MWGQRWSRCSRGEQRRSERAKLIPQAIIEPKIFGPLSATSKSFDITLSLFKKYILWNSDKIHL